MRIGGLQKLTLLDYPGKVACTVFLSGCNLRCPYCHNPGLVLPEQSEGSEIPEAEVLSFLERRKGKLDGVCITGGEPTLQPELPEFLEKLRRLGYAVKLDTNGTPTPPCSRRFCMSAFLTMWRWTLRTALLVMRKPAAASTAFPGCGRAPPC